MPDVQYRHLFHHFLRPRHIRCTLCRRMKRRTAQAPCYCGVKDKGVAWRVERISTLGISAHGRDCSNESEWQEALNRSGPASSYG
jgi:hypothetical protein